MSQTRAFELYKMVRDGWKEVDIDVGQPSTSRTENESAKEGWAIEH